MEWSRDQIGQCLEDFVLAGRRVGFGDCFDDRDLFFGHGPSLSADERDPSVLKVGGVDD
jgi:hypothetical protein